MDHTKRLTTIVAVGLILVFTILVGMYFSPITWSLRAPRNFQECVTIGGQESKDVADRWPKPARECRFGNEVFVEET
jgi:hypothetical protein